MSKQSTYRTLLRSPGVGGLLLAKLCARLPDVGLTLAALFLVRAETGSYAIAGASIALASGGAVVAGPWLARWIRVWEGRSRQVRIRGLALTASLFLLGFPLCSYADGPAWIYLLAGLGFGLTDPPIGSMIRSQWALRLPTMRHTAHAWENATTELLYALGPLLAAAALALGQVAPLMIGYALLLNLGALVYLRVEKPLPPMATSQPRLGLAQLQARVWPVLLVGLLWIITYDAFVVMGAAMAEQADRKELAGVWMSLFSAGGMVGALGYGAYKKSQLSLRGPLALGLTLYALLGALIFVPLWAVGLGVFVLGATSAVPFAALYLWAEKLSPSDSHTEVYQLIYSAMTVGAALGAISAGTLIDAAGVEPVAVLLVAASLGAALLAALKAPRQL